MSFCMALFNSENLIENWLNGIVIGCFKKKMKENYILLWSNLTETLLNIKKQSKIKYSMLLYI